MADNRVAVTGAGLVTPLGMDVESTWKALVSGQSGVDYITAFDSSDYETHIAAEVSDFNPNDHLDRKAARRMDRFVQFAVIAAREVSRQSELEITDDNAGDVGVVIGSGIGGLITLSDQLNVLRDKGPSRISPFLVPMMITDMASGQVSIDLGIKGPNYCTTSACSSGSDAIGTAYQLIQAGKAKAMVAGGAEASIVPIAVAGFNAAKALSTRNDDPQKACRPFDANRDGFVMGEGAALLMLEDMDHAVQRGAPILAELIGYGSSGDAFHVTAPAEGGEGSIRAMKMALDDAEVQPDDIDYINAHGTSTPLNDKFETLAIKKVFQEEAYRIPISSTKSMTGHLIGAAAALEAAVTVLAIDRGEIPPTINLQDPDPECDLDYTPHTPRRGEVKVALSNSLGFGGHNSVLIFRQAPA
jgi:3-oxoacyl-[acyl-carrier-protein] synthase II